MAYLDGGVAERITIERLHNGRIRYTRISEREGESLGDVALHELIAPVIKLHKAAEEALNGRD